jgi:N-acetylglucosamine-6-sulfatase
MYSGLRQFVCGLLLVLASAQQQRKNIVFVLTDDQDMILGGLTPMTKLKKLVIDKGILFKNAFVTTPICCPSRSSILTGKYIHNHGAHNNTIAGNCAGADWVAKNEVNTTAAYLKALGYRTMFAGKYLNQYGSTTEPLTHVPPGWDSWLGLKGNSVYYNYAVSDNGVQVKHGSDYSSDYFTDGSWHPTTTKLSGS